MNTVLYLPLLSPFIWVILCNPIDELYAGVVCYSGFYFLPFVLALISLVEVIVMQYFFLSLFTDYNPFSKIPTASSINNLNIFMNIIKIYCVIFIAFDHEVDFVIKN